MNYQPDLFAGAGIERSATNRAQNLSAAKAEMMATNSDTLFDAVERASEPAPAPRVCTCSLANCAQLHPTTPAKHCSTCSRIDHNTDDHDAVWGWNARTRKYDAPKVADTWIDQLGAQHVIAGRSGFYVKAACGYVGLLGGCTVKSVCEAC